MREQTLKLDVGHNLLISGCQVCMALILSYDSVDFINTDFQKHNHLNHKVECEKDQIPHTLSVKPMD